MISFLIGLSVGVVVGVIGGLLIGRRHPTIAAATAKLAAQAQSKL